jgi:hypothetical protein
MRRPWTRYFMTHLPCKRAANHTVCRVVSITTRVVVRSEFRYFIMKDLQTLSFRGYLQGRKLKPTSRHFRSLLIPLHHPTIGQLPSRCIGWLGRFSAGVNRCPVQAILAKSRADSFVCTREPPTLPVSALINNKIHTSAQVRAVLSLIAEKLGQIRLKPPSLLLSSSSNGCACP